MKPSPEAMRVAAARLWKVPKESEDHEECWAVGKYLDNKSDGIEFHKKEASMLLSALTLVFIVAVLGALITFTLKL